MLANMIGLSSEGLRQLLNMFDSPECKTQNVLIIDCRSFLAHNDSHIINSINVFYPPFLRRRNGNKPSLEAIISDSTVRDRLVSNYYYHIILYEEQELDLTKDSFGFYVARCLQEEAGIKCINYLEGGFSDFKKLYPLLCTNNLQNPVFMPSIVNKTKRSSSQYIYTWPFKSKSSLSYKPLTPRNALVCENISTYVLEDKSEPAELLPYLYLGSECHAASKSTLLKLGITAVLNVSHNCPNYFEDLFYYKRIAIKDSKHDDITVVINEALDFIDEIKSNSEGKIFVHCRAGISRSATIVIAYLIKAKRIRMEEAYEYVKSRRCSISPNFNYMTQLLAFEDQVLSNKN